MTTYDVSLTTLTYGGDALGRLPDGRAVFVPFALPGEKVRIRLAEQKRGHARGVLLDVLEPAPERIAPRCIHFGVCGGCHYQHLDYAAQLEVKRDILRDQLQRIGRLENPPVASTVPSPQPYYYRNHIQFDQTAEGKLGFHKMRSEQVFAIQECHLPEAPIITVWPQLDFEALPDIERIGLRLGADGDLQLILESESLETPELSVEELDISAVHLSPAGTLVMAGSEYVVIEVLGRPFRVSAGAFFQVNRAMAEAMVTHILSQLTLAPEMTVMDVYCGVGLFSAFLAPKVGRLVGVEAGSEAVEDFTANLDEFDNVEIYEGPAEVILPALDLKPDVILVDPPRAGLERPALDAIVRLAPATLIYISCDPSTLARDAQRLVEHGYRLEQVTPFDLFPQTFHIESISFWRKQ